MLAWELVVEAQALRSQGWTVSAIARHLGVTRVDGAPVSVRGADPGDACPVGAGPVRRVCRILPTAAGRGSASVGHHVVRRGRPRWAMPGRIRRSPGRSASGRCARCVRRVSRTPRPIERSIEHPPGAETQWDWVELPDPPTGWGWNGNGLCADRGVAAFGALARLAGRVDRSTASGGGP